VPTLAELQERLNTLTSERIPTLKAELQTKERQQAEAEEGLKALGWDGLPPSMRQRPTRPSACWRRPRMQLQQSRLQDLQERTNRLIGQRDLLRGQLRQAESSRAKLERQAEMAERSEQLLIRLGGRLREALKQTIEPLCTTAMQDVWGPGSGFKLEFSQTAGGRHKATIVTRSEHFTGPPAETDGDSVAELLSLVIRMSLVVLHWPKMAPLLVMDEPLGALDADNLPAVGSFLQDVARDLRERGTPLQIIFTAHHLAPVLQPYADNVVTVRKQEGASQVVAGLH